MSIMKTKYVIFVNRRKTRGVMADLILPGRFSLQQQCLLIQSLCLRHHLPHVLNRAPFQPRHLYL